MTIRLDKCSGLSWMLGGSPVKWTQMATPPFQPISQKYARFEIVQLVVGAPFLLLDTATGDGWNFKMTTTFAEWLHIEDRPLSEMKISQ